MYLTIDETKFGDVSGQVLVLSGGANGIGAATVKLFLTHGARVVFGDISDKNAEAFLESLDSSLRKNVEYVKTDVTKYDQMLELFDTAYKKFGSVDHAVHCAGLTEFGTWFDPNLTIESVRKPETNIVAEVNTYGTLYFARIAYAYLKDEAKPGDNKTLTLFASVAGFKESPGLFVYQFTKHGVLGLMRSLRKYPPVANIIRVNAVCPWMTLTGMVDGIRDNWRASNLPENTPEDLARNVMALSVDTSVKGESLFVGGGRGWLMEHGIDETEPVWLGEQNSLDLNRGQEVLGDGTEWTDRDECKK